MLSYHIRYDSTFVFLGWEILHANALFASLQGSCLVQVQTIFQNTNGKNVGNRTEDKVFCGENTEESEEISGVGHEGLQIVKSDAEKHNCKEYKVNRLIDCVDDDIAEHGTDDFILADNLPQTDGKVKIDLLAYRGNGNDNNQNSDK